MSRGFKMPGNLQGIMQQAQKLQSELQKVQEETRSLVAEGSSGGGMVSVMINGKHELVSIKINPEVVNPAEVEMLQDLIISAVNQGMKKVQDEADAKVKKITGGMGIPGM